MSRSLDDGADLTRLHALVAVRSVSGGKARLGEALDAEERETLIVGMLRHELRLLAAWPALESTLVVTADEALARCAAAEGARIVADPGVTLDAAIRAGREAAVSNGATALLILPADLPLLTAEALERLLEAADAAVAAGSGRPVVAIAPADARGGTNALLLSPPGLLEPAYGPDSLERHLRAARARDASVQLVHDPALGFDLDTPEDLERLDSDRLAALLALGTPLRAEP
ncbi:MAG TPA: 2-phospho-L-lactate guanylyltransferase [Candidatus Limnocylindrales bacterium]|nr:2-phospho-L-lactate guanylyltransferase [Candidatus Limnocylindrales bacterium]